VDHPTGRAMFARNLAAVVCLAALAAGCSPAYYTADADREVYGIVADTNAATLGRVHEFTVRPTVDVPAMLDGVRSKPRIPAPAAPKDPEAAAEEEADGQAAFESVVPERLPPPVPEPGPDAVRLTMADALRLAVRASRDYQAEKETVYLTALALTFQRYLFRPQPFATGTVDFANEEADGRQRSWSPTASVGVSQALADGAVIAGSIGITALKYLNRELGDTVDSALDFSLTQPLWRGAGRRIVQENLLQAQRNTVYAVRTFARFEQTFAVSIASQYLRVLQQRDVVMNSWQSYLSLKRGRERAEWLAQAERLAEFEVDEALQDELTAYNRWVVERENYTNDLDAFKMTLGIPVTTEIALEPRELARLSAAGLRQHDIDLTDATAKALATRLDLANIRDGLEDANRRITIAEDDLKGEVDLVASIGYASRSNRPQSARIALSRGDYVVGFDIDLPVDRLSERNALREAQITRQAAARALDLATDDVILDVRRACRTLDQARESYKIQRRSVALAERRVNSTQMLLQAGRATQRNVLDAEDALLRARNALTGALVTHTIAGLEFERDVGTLVVDEEGQIHGWILTDGGR